MSVTPSDGTLDLPEGGATATNKATPGIPPIPDIVFLVGTAASMGSAIANLQANITTILATVHDSQPPAHFAVAGYKDMQDAVPFVVLQNLTGNLGAVQNGVNQLTPTPGDGDVLKAFTNALFQLASGAIAFRHVSTRIIVWVGDAAGDEPSNGHTLAAAIAALQAAKIRVIALDVSTAGGSGLDVQGQATATAKATGGHVFKGVQPADVSSTILAALQDLAVTAHP
jgi:hypothetical protein